MSLPSLAFGFLLKNGLRKPELFLGPKSFFLEKIPVENLKPHLFDKCAALLVQEAKKGGERGLLPNVKK